MKIDLKESIFIVKKYYQFHSIVSVQRAYRVEFNTKTAPNDPAIRNIVSKFEKTGSVHHGNKGQKNSDKKG